ncbi:unnamed protein product [Haemonchus placei]|uniref:Uncharacterized protein n=1 Tax=Haemonchus placei TaxID=6290 RepID=A0A0N4WKA1_HAEPC|nr:unnamed protein product [Haemonchus placei]
MVCYQSPDPLIEMVLLGRNPMAAHLLQRRSLGTQIVFVSCYFPVTYLIPKGRTVMLI